MIHLQEIRLTLQILRAVSAIRFLPVDVNVESGAVSFTKSPLKALQCYTVAFIFSLHMFYILMRFLLTVTLYERVSLHQMCFHVNAVWISVTNFGWYFIYYVRFRDQLDFILRECFQFSKEKSSTGSIQHICINILVGN